MICVSFGFFPFAFVFIGSTIMVNVAVAPWGSVSTK
jgi:hypothetical protein